VQAVRVWVRALVVVSLLLPVGGYVAWSLASDRVPDPAPRAPMQLRPAESPAGADRPTPPLPSPSGTDGPGAGPEPVEPRLGGDDERDDVDDDRDDGADGQGNDEDDEDDGGDDG